MDSFLINLFVNPQSAPNPLLNSIFLIVVIWSIIIKGFGLYHSARHEEKLWFVGLLFINTLGILELVYLFFLSKQKMTIQEVSINFKKSITSLKQKNPLNKRQSSKK
jgi:hypothetical protein